MADNHLTYLRQFFHALAEGEKKHVLPRALRWLKAPGGQVFYWGELPAYTGQESVQKVTLHYREEYFDGESLVRLHDVEIASVEVGPCDMPRAHECSPKAIDEHLLAHAVGKLIELPSFGQGFVGGDDGRPGAGQLASE